MKNDTHQSAASRFHVDCHFHHAGGGDDKPVTAMDGGTAAPAGTMYTCPMDPEIRQATPGNCPICGLGLEPVMPSIEEGDRPELERTRTRHPGRAVGRRAVLRTRRTVDPQSQPDYVDPDREGRPMGLVAVSDPIKETTPEALAALREAGASTETRHAS